MSLSLEDLEFVAAWLDRRDEPCQGHVELQDADLYPPPPIDVGCAETLSRRPEIWGDAQALEDALFHEAIHDSLRSDHSDRPGDVFDAVAWMRTAMDRIDLPTPSTGAAADNRDVELQTRRTEAPSFPAAEGTAAPELSGPDPLHPEYALWSRLCLGDPDAIRSCFTHQKVAKSIAFLARDFDYPDLPGDLIIALSKDNWRPLRTWRGEASLATWIGHVAIRLCLNFKRREKRFVPMSESEEIDIADSRLPPDEFDEEICLEGMILPKKILLQKIAELPERERLICTMYYLDRTSPQEIAERFNIKKNNLYQINSRVKLKLWAILNAEGRKAGSHAGK